MGFVIKGGILEKYNEEKHVVDVIVPYGVTEIMGYAFSECSSLVSITIPAGVLIIHEYAFCKCSSLKSIKLPRSLQWLGSNIFLECSSLERIEVSNENANFCSIDGVLYNKDLSVVLRCPAKKTAVSLPESVTTIDDWAFAGCSSLVQITLSKKLTEIGYCGFSDCTSLESITIPYGVTCLKEGAFENCNSLTSIKLPESIEYIGEYAFSGCGPLVDVTIPSGVKDIGMNAFNWCESLINVKISESVTFIGSNAFGYCKSIASIDVAEDNKFFSSIDGVLFDKALSVLIRCPVAKTSVSIPESVVKIDSYAFANCERLTNITLPQDLKEIGGFAFDGCTSLTNITIPNSVTDITGDYILDGCASLKKLTVCGCTVDYSPKYEYNLKDIIAMLKSRDYSMRIDKPVKYMFVVEIYNKTKQPETEYFIRQNIKEIMHHFIDVGNIKMVKYLLEGGFMTKENILSFIEYAIDHTQQGGDVQIQVLLTNYRMVHFPNLDTTPLV